MEFNRLQRQLRSRRTEERIGAMKAAERLEPGPRQALLLEALGNDSHYVAALAAEALRDGADEQAIPALINEFLRRSDDGIELDPGCHIRSHLAFALGRLQAFAAVDTLRVGITARQIEPVGGGPFDTAAHLRANCALALGRMRHLDSIREIALLLFDCTDARGKISNPIVKMETRKAAAQALRLTGSAHARLPLTLRLSYPELELPEVLQECMEALVELEDPQALAVLVPYLRNPDERLVGFAALMVARTQDPDAAEMLREAIEHMSGDCLQTAMLALTTLRTPEAYTALHALARSSREAVQLAALAVLPDDQRSREILEALASRAGSLRVQRAAREALTARE